MSFNLSRAVNAAGRQMAAITKLKNCGLYETLPADLKEAAKARWDNPETSLAELAGVLYMSKSGLQYRLRKLMRLADTPGE